MTDHHAHGGEHGEGSTTGVHGMLLFGDEVVYLSHLPMFAAPHNFQVLLEVELNDVARETYLADRHVAPVGIYTFVPEPFPIVELDSRADGPARTSIDGTIFRGHFERGGVSIAEGVVAEVRRVVHFSELDIGATRPQDPELTYLCFGRARRLHLAHEVTARPDFDHVLTARLVPDTVTNQAGQQLPDDVGTIGFELAQRVRFAGRSDTPENRLVADEIADGLFFQTTSLTGAHGFRVHLESGRELYIEVDELK
jgi:hypothetical protein